MTIETIQAGKTTLTLTHGVRLSFVDTAGIPRTVEADNAVRLYLAIKLGSGVTVQTVKTEGRDKPTNCTGAPIRASYHS